MTPHRSRLTIAILLLTGAITIPWWVTLHQEQDASGRRVGIVVPVEREMEVLEVLPGSPAEKAGLRAGDVVVDIDGRPIATEEDYDVVAPGFRRGEALAFTVVRDGRETLVEVRPGVRVRWSILLGALALAFAYLAPGAIALRQHPGDPRARLLFVFGVAVALEMALVLEIQLYYGWTLARFGLYYLLTGLQIPIELHLAARIPTAAEWLRKRPWLPPVGYAAGIAFGLATATAFLSDALGWGIPLDVDLVNGVLFPIVTSSWAIAVVLILAHQVRRAAVPQRRYQAALVLLGVLPWAVFTLSWELLGAFGLPVPAWMTGLETWVLLAYPVAVFVAIFRYRLFDIATVVKRGLVYGALTLLLVAVFYLLLGAGGLVMSEISGDGGPSIWLIAAATLALGLLFAPLRSALQSAIDRRMFPERLALRQRLAALASHLPALGSLPQMGDHLAREIRAIYGVRSVELLLVDENAEGLVPLASTASGGDRRGDSPVLVDRNDPVLEELLRHRRPMPRPAVERRSTSLGSAMRATDAETVFGLHSGDELVGVLLLGTKESGERLSAEERELLSLFSHNLATVLQNTRLYESASYDGLTGLYRREKVLDALERELQRARRYGRPLSVAMADIDRFKDVNDRFGHLVGDALLQSVARELTEGLRDSDVVGRYGGEEFLIVLPETRMPEAVSVADKLRRRVGEVRLDPRGEARLTISIGVASLDGGDREATARALIDAADRRLLNAKRSGRDQVVPLVS